MGDMVEWSDAQRIRDEFGRTLRSLRTNAGMTGLELSRRVGVSASKISRIENGMVGVTDITARNIVAALGAHGSEGARLVELAEAIEASTRSSRKGQSRNKVLNWVSIFESADSVQVVIDRVCIPALLQTPAYIHEMANASRGLVTSACLQLTRGRCQPLLWDPSRRFEIYFPEASLYNAILDPIDMQGQLAHILAIMRIPSVTIGLLPRDTTWWLPMNDFSIIDDRRVIVDYAPDIGCIDAPDEVAAFRETKSHAAKFAIRDDAARNLILDAIGAFAVDLREASTANAFVQERNSPASTPRMKTTHSS